MLNVLAWIVIIGTTIVGVLMIIFPDFFVELSDLWDNEFLYWIGAGFTFNTTNFDRVVTRIFGAVIVLVCIVMVSVFLL